MIDLVQMRTALAQTLENYQRSGLVRFPKAPLQSLPPQFIDIIASARASSQVSSASTSSPISTSGSAARSSTAKSQSAPIAEPQSGSTSSAAARPAAPISPNVPASVDSQTSASPWTLPVLSMGERQTRFSALKSDVQSCRKCADIVCFRQQIVFGVGPLTPTVVFMGEAPGADEDKQGVPFVGKAGQLLTKIIEAMQLKRDDVFILNALKCRPPQNRTPVPEEIEHCRPFVETQLEVLQPKYIVCLGAVAVRSLLGLTQAVGSLRGRFHSYRQARVVVTYHPSYLLRNESAKKLVWQDMQMLMRELGLKLPEKRS